MSEAPLDSLWLRLLPQPVRSRLVGRRLLQTLIENAGWLVADKVVRLGVGLLVGVWVARYLAPQRFGTLNYVQALVGLVSALATMGLPDIIVRDFVRHKERGREIAATGIAIRLVGAALSILVAALSVIVVRPGETEVLALTVIVASSLLPQSLDVVDQFYQARNQVRAIVILRNGAFLVTAFAKILAIIMDAPLIVFAFIFTLEFVFMAAGFVIFAARNGVDFGLRHATLIEAQRMTRDAWPLLVRQLAVGVYMRVDQVLLGRLLDDHAVGIYAAAARISEVWYFIPVAIMTSVVPRLAAKHAESDEYYRAALRKVMQAIAALSILQALFMSLGSTFIIHTLYGNAYAASASVLAIHAWAGLFVGMGVASTSWFVNTRNIQFGLYQAVLGAVVSLGLNLVLIPRFGVVGAALTTVASQFVSAVAFNACFRRTRPIFFLQLEAFNPLRWFA